jgi:hypothetical protein
VEFHDDNITADNPKGIGDFFGELETPYGSSWGVSYCDGDRANVKPGQLRLCAQLGDVVTINDVEHELSWFDDKGSHWLPVHDGNETNTKKGRRPRNTDKPKEQTSVAGKPKDQTNVVDKPKDQTSVAGKPQKTKPTSKGKKKKKQDKTCKKKGTKTQMDPGSDQGP